MSVGLIETSVELCCVFVLKLFIFKVFGVLNGICGLKLFGKNGAEAYGLNGG